MNWIKNFLKPKIKSLFKKKSSELEESLWITCVDCKALIMKDEFKNNLFVCPKCNSHRAKVEPRDRFSMFFDNNYFETLDQPIALNDDPLNFKAKKNYKDQLKEARGKTNQSDSILVAHGKLDGMKVTCAAMSFSFIGGSLSQNSGESFVNGAAYAIENKTPFIVYTASGGARMQESLIALSQMTRTTLAVSELKRNNIPYIVVLTHPTSGGVTASFASLGDISIGEPGATVGFAGARVIKDTVRETLPKSFQETEWHLEHSGMIDMVVERKYLRSTIIKLLQILLKKKETQAISDSGDVDNEINTKTFKNQSA